MSRMSKLCSWCGGQIPAELRFSPEEAAAILRDEAEAAANRDTVQKQRAQKKSDDAVAELTSEVATITIRRIVKTFLE